MDQPKKLTEDKQTDNIVYVYNRAGSPVVYTDLGAVFSAYFRI